MDTGSIVSHQQMPSVSIWGPKLVHQSPKTVRYADMHFLIIGKFRILPTPQLLEYIPSFLTLPSYALRNTTPMMIPTIFVAVALVAFGTWLINLIQNYNAARKLNLPIIILPFTWQFPLWNLVGPKLISLEHLPLGLGSWIPYSLIGWSLTDRYKTHARLGPAFVFVSPWRNEIMLADAAAARFVLSSNRRYINDPNPFATFDVFGPNLFSSNGADWQRHRKIAGVAFKEENTRAVWLTACNQARAFSRACCARAGEKGISLAQLNEKLRLIAMHVLSAAGFGREYDFEDGLTETEKGHQMSYGAAFECGSG